MNSYEQTDETDLTKPAGFAVEDVYWGYIVKSSRRPSAGVLLAQLTSFVLGAGFLAAASGILLIPTVMFEGDLGPMRMGAAVLFAGFAFLLLWFASRGSRTQLHVDTSVGEIREVICNRAGRPTTVGCYGFDAIGGIYLEQRPANEKATLVLRYRNTNQTIGVAEGPEAQLASLRDRLGRDLMVETQTGRSFAA